MRFVVVGTGAIGGVVGGRLAASGHDVALIARGAQLAAIRERGLRVESPDGAFVVTPPVHDAPGAVAWRDHDVVLACMKTQDLAAALTGIPTATPVACLTNGIEAERIALRRFAHVLGVRVMCPATFLVPGTVQAWSAPVVGRFDVGCYPDGRDGVALAIVAAFVRAGFAADVRADVMRWKRGKLLANLGNAIEALSRTTEASDPLLLRARAEGLACFAAAGLSSTTDAEEAASAAGIGVRPIDGQLRGGGSMWQSFARWTGSVESDYLNGEIALLGRLHGVPTPVNSGLQRLIAKAMRDGIAPGSLTLDELATKLGV